MLNQVRGNGHGPSQRKKAGLPRVTNAMVTLGSPAYFVLNKKSRGFPSPAHAGFGSRGVLMVVCVLVMSLDNPTVVVGLFS